MTSKITCKSPVTLVASYKNTIFKASDTPHNKSNRSNTTRTFCISGRASTRGRENVGGVGGASQIRARATAETSRLSDPEGHEGVHGAADCLEGQEGQEGWGKEQRWQEGEEMRGRWLKRGGTGEVFDGA